MHQVFDSTCCIMSKLAQGCIEANYTILAPLLGEELISKSPRSSIIHQGQLVYEGAQARKII